MEKVITVSRSSLKQESVVKYDESSTNESLIKKKELTIKSLSALQLLITTLSDDQKQELSNIISLLEDTCIQVEQILNLSDGEDNFYETYRN